MQTKITHKGYEYDMSSSDILEALQYSLSMEGLRALSGKDLVKMEQMLYHWQRLAAHEIEARCMRGEAE